MQTIDLLNEEHPGGVSKNYELLPHRLEELYEEHAYEERSSALIYKIAREIKGEQSHQTLMQMGGITF